MVAASVHELDALDAIDEDVDLRDVILRLARLAERGRLGAFTRAVESDGRLNDETRSWLLAIAREPFLEAAGRYAELCRPTPRRHGYNPARRAISSVG
ncbi:MAG: hypothetical protein M3304_09885 [Actinomycetota bacterium]|nr:hypothetical protein [Actinomycetota bacterium]